MTIHDRPAADVTTFELAILPHLNSGARLARRLMSSGADADDAVQDALVCALRYFRTFDGRNSRGWFLRIVRNSCYSAQARQRRRACDWFDEEQHSDVRPGDDQGTRLLQRERAEAAARAIATLPPRLRGVLLGREVDSLSYRELAERFHTPIGTVMSRLARARRAARAAVHTAAHSSI